MQSPLDFDYVRFMLGLSSTGSSISAAPASSKRTTRILLVPRGDPNAPVIEIKSDSKDYAFHFANAFDDPVTGEVVFDVCQCKDKLFFGDMKGNLLWENPDWAAWPETYLTRYRIDPVGKRIVERKENGVKGLINTEFPSVADSVSSAPHRFVFTLNSPYQAVPYGVQKVGKIDTLTRLGDFFFDEETKWYSEPQFIPREGQQGGKGEDFGYLLSTVSDGATHKSEVVIFDAQNVSQGPICRIPVEPFLPHSLHGAFYPDAVFHIDLLQKSFQEVR
jgi:all-trans-8'-apo-beta-carotenal 15,15'-oxygenase